MMNINISAKCILLNFYKIYNNAFASIHFFRALTLLVGWQEGHPDCHYAGSGNQTLSQVQMAGHSSTGLVRLSRLFNDCTAV